MSTPKESLSKDCQERYRLALSHIESGRFRDAEKILRAILKKQPTNDDARYHLLLVLCRVQKLVEAESLAIQWIAEGGDNRSLAYFYLVLANVYQDLGEPNCADESLKEAARLDPESMAEHGSAIFISHYLPSCDARMIFEEAKSFDSRFTRRLLPERRVYTNTPRSDRKIRLGLLSGYFHQHPVGFFALPAIHHLDRTRFEVFVYDNGVVRDWVSDLFRRESDSWVCLHGMSDEEAFRRIRQDEIDIMLDLAGYSGRHRMGVMARRPAPILAKWVGGQIGTTGTEAFDYFISDQFETPSGSEPFYSETLLRLPDDYVCYMPPPYAPPVSPLPAARNGYITLGGLNRLSKINDELLSLWSIILKRLPDARLFIKAGAFDDEDNVERVRGRFSNLGIEPSRIIFEGHSPHYQLLESYSLVDIALDTWPYSGGLTTCEAMWMGVPTITLAGSTFSGRHSVTHLANSGNFSWVAQNREEYVDKAVALAEDLYGLVSIRRNLRRKVADSPLCDAPRFTRNLERELERIWRLWCECAADSREKAVETGACGAIKEKISLKDPSWEADGADIDRACQQGLALLEKGEVMEAGRICVTVLKISPNRPSALYLAGRVSLKTGSPQNAVEHFESAWAKAPWREDCLRALEYARSLL